MKSLLLTMVVTAWIFSRPAAALAQDHMKGMDMP